MSIIGIIVLIAVGVVIGVIIGAGLVVDIKRERAMDSGNLRRYFDAPTSGSIQQGGANDNELFT